MMSNENNFFKKDSDHKKIYETPVASIFWFTANAFLKISGETSDFEDDYMTEILPNRFF